MGFSGSFDAFWSEWFLISIIPKEHTLRKPWTPEILEWFCTSKKKPIRTSVCSLRSTDVFPVVASLPPKNNGGREGRETTTGNTSALRRLLLLWYCALLAYSFFFFFLLWLVTTCWSFPIYFSFCKASLIYLCIVGHCQCSLYGWIAQPCM